MGHEKADDIEGKIKELRMVTREANEAIQSLREARQGFVNLMEAAHNSLEESADKIVADALGKALDGLKSSTEKAIVDATDAVYQRFDTITAVLLGEDRKGKKRGDSIPDMIARMPTRTCCGGKHVSNTCPYSGVPGTREGDI